MTVSPGWRRKHH